MLKYRAAVFPPAGKNNRTIDGVDDMSRQLALEAIWPITVTVDGKTPDIRHIEYTKEWFDKLLEQNQDIEPEGRLIIGCSYRAGHWMFESMEEVQERGGNVFMTDEEHICGEPEPLCKSILENWNEWHEQDERWHWSANTITQFFELYKWAIIYVNVY